MFGEIWVFIHTEGKKEATIINKGSVPLKEATSTFLNYGKSFSKRILQGFSRQKGGKTEQTLTNVSRFLGDKIT